MREGCFKVTDTNRHVVQPLLNAVNGRSHRREMFENQVFGDFGHGRSLSSRQRCAMIEDIATCFKHAPMSRYTRSSLEVASN
jgi:hypothetical protein